MEDKNLLVCYMAGFHDELHGTSTIEYRSDIENKAYKLGAMDAIVGDDVTSIDCLSDDDILKMIKK